MQPLKLPRQEGVQHSIYNRSGSVCKRYNSPDRKEYNTAYIFKSARNEAEAWAWNITAPSTGTHTKKGYSQKTLDPTLQFGGGRGSRDYPQTQLQATPTNSPL